MISSLHATIGLLWTSSNTVSTKSLNVPIPVQLVTFLGSTFTAIDNCGNSTFRRSITWKRFGEIRPLDCKPTRNPLPSNFRPIPATDEEHAASKHRPYPQVVGAVRYAATITRPDLAHATSVLLSRFISKWNKAHWTAAKHLLRYIRGTSDICLTFTSESGKRIALGADADWGGDLDTRRSTTGYVFKVYGGIVAWKSRRQPTVAPFNHRSRVHGGCGCNSTSDLATSAFG